MNVEEFRDYCLSLGEVTEKMPFGKFARRYDSVLAFYTLDHMFCFVDIDDFNYVNVKSTPGEIATIRASHTSVSDPLNRSLRYWIQLNLNGDITDCEISACVRRAYDIVREKYQKKTASRPKNNPSNGKP